MKYLFILLVALPFAGFTQTNKIITNKDYNEFVTYVRDSLLRQTMGEEIDEDGYLIWEGGYNSNIGKPIGINWKTKLDLNWPESREALEPWYYEPVERLNRKREFDTRKLIHNGLKIYPDVLVWCRDSTINKSWGTFLATYYYTHPYFKDYPVQGLSQEQIEEYRKWKYPQQKKKITHLTQEISLILPKEKLQFTVGEYFEFYKYTRDSIIRKIIGKEIDEVKYLTTVNDYSESINPPIIKWKYKIKWEDELIKETLTENHILSSKNQIDNRRVMYDYTWLNYYKAITLPDSTKRNLYFGRMAINITGNNYMETYTNIDIKKQLKDKSIAELSGFDTGQIRAFYYWKKSSYPKKDVFDGFIPYGNHTFYEMDPEHFMDDNDLELLRTGKLSADFYNFSMSIPVISIEE